MSDNPFLNRIKKQGVGHNGRVAETKLAKRIGAKLTPASGAMTGAKGDMKRGNFLIESKATQNESMSLKRDWLLKINIEALETGKLPALAVIFTNESGKSEPRDRWIMLKETDFIELVSD